ncbi:hypothetical protein [Wenzhouxiangella marina]|uniref:Uncharacterized protein n=1 Tax=Wenzhouxiangella marina TaxID=1579979 RepID=A0A0K0XUC7_9GAMM|nr:hypothetical protein [Wenzhouxiangella marina]AKS41288.1 hypothetical protein WM2015_907 [Wenzhouxiangella marina]MBB6086962.1 hypothetical protein [Wenzhouxiangella marina]
MIARVEGASAAGVWLSRRLGLDPADIRTLLLALQPPVRLPDGTPALLRAYEQRVKHATLFVLAFLILGGGTGLACFEPDTFVTLWWPGCLLLLLALWLSRPAPYGHPGLIMIGIVLIPISGVVAVALGQSQDEIPILGLPLILLSLICLAFGMAEALFAHRVPPGAASAAAVRRHRVSRRIARIVLASYVLAPILALNVQLAEGGVVDEAGFNALFRFGLFLIVASPVTALFCVPLGRSIGDGVLALVTPLAAAVWVLKSGAHFAPSLLLTEAAVIQLLAVYLTIVGGLVRLSLSRGGRRRLAGAAGIYLLLVVGLVLGYGALGLLNDTLLAGQPQRASGVWALQTLVPAALIAAAVIRRGDFDFGFVR